MTYTVDIPITLIVTDSVAPTTYTVTYDGNGATSGSVPTDSNNYASGVSVTVLGNTGSLAKTGFTFGGWSDGTNTYQAGDNFSMPASNVTLKAVWTASKYTVDYDANGHGTAPNAHENLTASTSFTVDDGTGMTEAGWTFVQWEYPVGTAQSGSTTVTALTGNSPQDVTLVAKWKQNQYTVKYKDDVDTVITTLPGDATVTYSEAINLPTQNAPGYTFDGWYYNGAKVASGASISSLNSSLNDGGSITLEAVWTADGVTLNDQTVNAKEGVALTSTTYQVSGGHVSGVTYTYTVKDPTDSSWKNAVTINGVTITGGAGGLTVSGTPTAGSGDPSNPRVDTFEVKVVASNGESDTATYTVKTPAPPQITDANITSNNAAGIVPGATLTINTITLSYSGDVASPANGNTLGGANFEVAEWHMGGSAGTTGPNSTGPNRDYGKVTADVSANGQTMKVPADATSADYIWVKLVGKTPNVSADPCWVKLAVAKVEKKVTQAIVYVNNTGAQIAAPSDGASSVTINAASGVALGASESANLTASVNTGKTDRFIFKGWSASANGANPVTANGTAATNMHLSVGAYSATAGTAVFTMPNPILTTDTTIYAVFEVRPQADLTLGVVVVNADGTGTVTPAAGDISISPNAADLFGGKTYNLSTSTTNAAKYTFLGWSVKSSIGDLMTSGSVNTTNVVKSGTPSFGLISSLSSTNSGGTAVFTMPDPAADKTLYAVYQAAPMSDLVLGVCIKDLGASGAVSNTKPTEINLGGGDTDMLNGATTTVYTATTDPSVYTFKGWATNANGTGTLITGTNGGGLTNLVYSTAGGSGTYTMSGADGNDKNLWAVYEKVATYVLTVTKATGIASVTVSVNGVEKTAGAGGTYSGIKATDTVVITSSAAANYSTDGFEVTAGSSSCSTVNQTDSSFICKINGAVTVNAKAKGMASLKLITTDSGNSKQVGTLATTDVAYAGHLDNEGNATSGSVSYSLHPNADGTGSQTDFALSAPTAAAAIAAGGSTNISVTVANTGLAVGPHTVYLKITETGGSGYSTIVPITFTVTAEPAATTFDGTVTIYKDKTTAATPAPIPWGSVSVQLQEAGGTLVSNSTKTTNASGVVSYTGLDINKSYEIWVKVYPSGATAGTYFQVQGIQLSNGNKNPEVQYYTVGGRVDTTAAAVDPTATISGTWDGYTVSATNPGVVLVAQENTPVTFTAAPSDTSKYAVKEWKKETTSATVQTGGTVYSPTITGKEVYTVYFEKKAQVTLSYNGNEAQIADLASGTVVAVPPAQTDDVGASFPVSTMKPVLGGYVFKGWSETDTGTTPITATSYTLTANKTLYAIWEKAAITIPDQTVTDGVYGSGYNYTVSASRNDSVSGLKYTITGLPGGLGYDSATGRIYGIPYEVGTKTISVTVEPAQNTSYRTDTNAFKATKSLSLTVGKALPTVTGISPVGSVVSGVDLNTVGWTVTVVGPRFTRSTALTDGTASTADDWDMAYTDTIIYPAGKLGPADMTSGIGQATISSTGNKFSSGASTQVKAEFEPRAMGTNGTASTDFDASATSKSTLHNKQNGVWKEAEGTKPVSHSGNKPILEISTDGGTTFNANQSWLYAVQTTNAPAHEGYSVNASGATGYVTAGSGTAADTVAAKEFIIKNNGSDTTGNLTWSWTSNGATVDGTNYTFTPAANTLPTTAITAGNQTTVKIVPPADAPAGTYTGTLTVSGGGSTATINVTFVVTNAKTFTAAIKVDKQAMGDTNLLENRKFPSGLGLKLVSGSDSVTVTDATHWLSGATEGNANGVYTVAGLAAGKTYRLVATGVVGGDYDTGITVSSAAASANIVYYQINTDKDPGDLTLSTAQTGKGWYVKDQYATLTTPASGTKSGSTYDFKQWEQGSGDSKKTYGGTTATVKVEAGNVTYKAVYTVRAAGTSTVTYKSNTQSDGGPDMTVVTVTNGDTHTVLPGPSQEGYLFTGWNTDKDGADTGTAYAAGATMAAATVQTNPTLFAQWAPATIQDTWGPGTDTGVYGTAYRWTVPTPTTSDGKGVTLSVDASTLPGGLHFDPATGLISGIPYEVGAKAVKVTATHNYWNGSDAAHNYPGTSAALTKTYTLNLTIGPATPVVTSITPTGSVVSDANLNTVGWTVTVQGPRYKKTPVPAADTASTTDDWETFTDTIVYPVGKLGPADMTSGVGQATISATGGKFSTGASTNVKAEFEPRAMGADGTAGTNFDTAAQKQSTVWKEAEATLAIPHSGDAPELQVSSDGGTTVADSLTWLYAVNNAGKDPAHVGYGAGTGTDGYVVAGTPDTVAPKEITLKNTGTAETGALTYTWLSNGATVGGTAYTFTDNINDAAKATIPAGQTRKIVITPPAGAPAGTYTGTLQVKGANGGVTLVNVKFVVVDPTAYTVTIKTNHHDLDGTEALKNVSGSVVLTQLNDNGTLSSTTVSTSGTNGVYTGSAVFGKKYAVTVNGFRVPNLTITTQNPEATVDLYQVTVVDDPAVGTSVTNASTVDKGYVVKGDDVTVTYSTTPKTGYSFKELQDITTAGSPQVRATGGTSYTQPITSATAFKVVWKLADTEYTLTFDGNSETSGDAPDPITVAAGTAVILPGQNTLEKTGFVFKGWGETATAKPTDATGFYYAGSSYTVNASKTLYAVWEPAAGGVFLLDKEITVYYGEDITGESLSYVGTPVGTPSYAVTSTLAGDNTLDPLNPAKWDGTLSVGSSDAAITGTPKLSNVTSAGGAQTYKEGPFTLDVKMTDDTGDHTATLTVKVEKANTAVDPADPPAVKSTVTLKPGDTFDPATQLDPGKVDAIKHNGTDKLQESVPGTWSLAEGEDGTIGGGPKQIIKLVFTPFDEGFKPTTYDLEVDVAAKKIAETVLEVTFPANSPDNKPVYTGAVDSATAKAGSVVAAAKTDVSIVKDADNHDVSWTTGVNSAGQFEASEDKVLYMVIRPKTDDNWVFVTKAAGDGPVKVTLKDKVTGATVEATVISCTETEATVTYKWDKQDVAATDIKDQVVKPVDKAHPNFTAVPIGTPAGSHTTNTNVKWVKSDLDGVKADNYTGLTGLTASDTFTGGEKYVAIVTADVATGYYFDATKLAALNGDNDYAQIRGDLDNYKNAKVLSVTKTGDKATQVVIAVEFTAEESKVVGLNSATGPLVYYAKTNTHTATSDTGHDTNYDFTLDKGDFTVNSVNSLGAVSPTTSYALFVDNGATAGEYDTGDTILVGTTAAGNTYDFENVYGAAADLSKGTGLDGKELWAVLLDASGNPSTGAQNATRVGTLTVKELRADRIAQVGGTVTLTYTTTNKAFAVPTAPTATVDFNLGAPMANAVTGMTYAAYSNASAGSKTFFYEMGDANAPGFVAHNATTGALAAGALIDELTVGANVTTGKTLYMTYVDKNNNLVRTPIGVFRVGSSLGADFTDENGHDPEYGDKLTAQPEGGTPKPDGTYDYKWEYEDTDGSWKPITGPDGQPVTTKDYTPGKDDVGKKIHVVITDGNGDSATSREDVVEKRSLNFVVAPQNKQEDKNDDNIHEYVTDDFTLTRVLKELQSGAFVDAAPVYGGVMSGDTVTLSPATATGNWNTDETTRPQYASAAVGSEITWPKVLDSTGVTDGVLGGYVLSDADHYRLAPQDEQTHRGIIQGGGGDIIHVDVSFEEVPVSYHDVPGEPMGVTDDRETRPGEDTGTSVNTTQDYIANWYTAANASAFNGFDPTSPTGTAVTMPNHFEPGQAYTVLVKVKPQPGKFYNLTGDRATHTKFYFHFGTNKSVEVVQDAAGLTPSGKVSEVKTGLKVDDGVYYMWYTFTAPDNRWVSPTGDGIGWPNDITFDDQLYYAKTGTSDKHYQTNAAGTDNSPTPGGKGGIPFDFRIGTDFVTVMSNAATANKPFKVTTDTNTQVTLTSANYGSFWRLVAGPDAAQAQDQFLDTIGATWTATASPTGKTFTDAHTVLSQRTVATDDSIKFAAANIYVQINDAAKTVLKTPLTTLAVRQLVVENIAVDPLPTLSYTENSDGSDVKFDSNSAKATVHFNTGDTGLNVEYTPLDDAANAAAAQSKKFYFEYLDYNDSSKKEEYKPLVNGTTVLTNAAHDGKLVYACYTDVNGHVVRTVVGRLSVAKAGETPKSTAAIYIKNNTHGITDTQYGDQLEAVVTGVSTAEVANVTYKWQRKNASGAWEDIQNNGANVTSKTYIASKADVGTEVRVEITGHTGHTGAAGVTSNEVEVAKKKLTVEWTWVPGSKVWDNTADAPATTTSTGDNYTYNETKFKAQLTHGNEETAKDDFTLTAVTAGAFADANVGTGKLITLTGGDIPTTGGTANGAANTSDWNNYYELEDVGPYGEIYKRKIAHVNVSIDQPVVEKTPNATGTKIQVLGNDGSDLKANLTVSDVSWYEGATGSTEATKFEAGKVYRAEFDLTADTYTYMNKAATPADANNVFFTVSGVGTIEGAGSRGTSANPANSVITSVTTTATDAENKYHVVVLYETISGGKVALTDVYVNATDPNTTLETVFAAPNGIHGDPAAAATLGTNGPWVNKNKPYALTETGTSATAMTDSVWQYWNAAGNSWTAVNAATKAGLTDDGKFKPGTTYRVVAKVKLTDDVHYQITEDTSFYLAGIKCDTTAVDSLAKDAGALQYTPLSYNGATATDGVYPTNANYTLIQEFTIPAPDTVIIQVDTNVVAPVGGNPVSGSAQATTDYAFNQSNSNVLNDGIKQDGKVSVTWHKWNGTAWAAYTDASFGDGEFYMAELTFETEEGYSFRHDTDAGTHVTFNANGASSDACVGSVKPTTTQATGSSAVLTPVYDATNDKYTVYIQFPKTSAASPIGNVHVTYIEPAVDNSPTKAEAYGSTNVVSLPNGASDTLKDAIVASGVAVDGSVWYTGEVNEDNYATSTATNTVTFAKGQKYTVATTFKPVEGFLFTEDTKFTVNVDHHYTEKANSKQVILHDNGYATVFHTFEIKADSTVIVKADPTVNVPVAGGKLQKKTTIVYAETEDGKNVVTDGVKDDGKAAITWYTRADNGTLTQVGSTVTSYAYSTAYTAKFTIEADGGYSFLAKTTPNRDFIDFFVNDYGTAVNWNDNGTSTHVYTYDNGTAADTADDIKVTLTRVSDNKYDIQIDFPKTDDDVNKVTEVHVDTMLPPAYRLSVPTASVRSNQPYEDVGSGAAKTAKWQSFTKDTDGDGTPDAWEDVAANATFQNGVKYRVTAQVHLKQDAATKRDYDITNATKFYIGDVEIPQTATTETRPTGKNYTYQFEADQPLSGTDTDYADDTVYTVTLTYDALVENKVIVDFGGNVADAPVAGGTIADSVVNKFFAHNKDGDDVKGHVTVDNLTWKSSADGTSFTSTSDTTFQKDTWYQASFTVEADTANGYHFDSVVDFYVNGAHVQGVGSADKPVKVTTEKVGGSADKYKITVTFPQTKDKADIFTVWGLTDPKVNTSIDVGDLKVPANEPYEIVSGADTKWEHWNETSNAWEAASGNFLPGHIYKASIKTQLKTSGPTKGKYQFTSSVDGYINDMTPNSGADQTMAGTKVTYLKDDGTEITKGAADEPKFVTVERVFPIPNAKTEVHVASDTPKPGPVGTINDTIAIPADFQDKYEFTTDPADQKGWFEDDGATAVTEFKEDTYYKLIVNVTPKDGYDLPDVTEKTKYIWDNNGERYTVEIVKDADGSHKVTFRYRIPKEGEQQPIGEIPGNVTKPEYDQPLDRNGWTSENFTVKEVEWFEGAVDKVDDLTGKTPATETNAKQETIYTAKITLDPKDGIIIADDGTLKYTFNGEDITAKPDQYKKNDDGTYTLIHTFPKTGKPKTEYKPGGSSGGGGGGTTELPQVFYKLGEVGVTNDLTAEKVKVNGKPSKVPKVEGIEIEEKDGTKKTYTFIGWSETDPATTTGKPVLVDPTTFKITKDKTFYAVYEIQGHTAIDHSHYVIGFPNGTFGPGADITRGEVATIIARACLDGFIEGANYGNPGGYSDVERHWAYSAISYCTMSSVFTGYTDGTFRPNQPITRQELATVVARLAGLIENQGMPFTDADQVSKWALDGVYTAYANGWINGYKDGSFKPRQNITRAETVKIFNAYLKRGVDKEGLSDMREYVHDGVASNNKENGYDQYMTWPDVPTKHWAYYEIIEAANDHTFYWLEDDNPTPPEHWTSVWIDEVWRYHDNNQDGARPENPDTTTPSYSYGK